MFCLHVYPTCTWYPGKSEKPVDERELELQMVVSSHVSARDGTKILYKNSKFS